MVAMAVTGCGGDPAAFETLVGPSTPAVSSGGFEARCAAPAPPDAVDVSVDGSTVHLHWASVDAATDYVVAAGSNPGGMQSLLRNTAATAYQWQQAPSGVHYARVYAHSRCGTSAPSRELAVVIER